MFAREIFKKKWRTPRKLPRRKLGLTRLAPRRRALLAAGATAFSEHACAEQRTLCGIFLIAREHSFFAQNPTLSGQFH